MEVDFINLTSINTMKNFNWMKAIGFGIVIWAVLFALVWASMSMAVYGSIITKLVLVIVAASLAYSFTPDARFITTAQALGYGVSFVVVGVLLDLIVSRQFDSAIFSAWEYWLSYALILISPMFRSEGSGVLGQSRSRNISHA